MHHKLVAFAKTKSGCQWLSVMMGRERTGSDSMTHVLSLMHVPGCQLMRLRLGFGCFYASTFSDRRRSRFSFA